jgi:hypothetical protein
LVGIFGILWFLKDIKIPKTADSIIAKTIQPVHFTICHRRGDIVENTCCSFIVLLFEMGFVYVFF